MVRGFRSVIFVQGCKRHCLGCHNPETWSLAINKNISIDELVDKIRINNIITGVTYSGGEPFLQVDALIELSKKLKDKYQNISIWSYSGFTFEELIKNEKYKELLNYLEVLVDGAFILEKRDISLLYRGSSNQRLIDVQKSLKTNSIQLYKIVN